MGDKFDFTTAIESDLEKFREALVILNDAMPEGEDEDLTQAVRSIGALIARWERKLRQAQHYAELGE